MKTRIVSGEKLYKIDTKGKTRVWWMEYDAEKYRTHSGIENGKIVVSGWKYPTAKNEGRANATTVEQQVVLEVNSQYVKKQNQGKYHSTKEDTAKGAAFHEPMLATKYNPDKDTNFPYYSQPKLDGIRAIITKDGIQSRNGKPIVSCPHILEALDPFFEVYPAAVLDGELYNHNLKDDFEKIVSLVRKTKPTWQDFVETSMLVQYHVYDEISDARLGSRNAFLEVAIGKEYEPVIHVVETNEISNLKELEGHLEKYLLQGYEGQMLRDPHSLYEGKRSKGLLKHKEFEDAEFEIVEILEGEGNWADAAKSVKIRLEDGSVQESGVRGSQEFLAGILENADEYIGTEVTVRYQRRTAAGKLRFPVVVAFWKGKRDL